MACRILGISRSARWSSRRIVDKGILQLPLVAGSCVRTSCTRAFERCELLSTFDDRSWRSPLADYMPSRVQARKPATQSIFQDPGIHKLICECFGSVLSNDHSSTITATFLSRRASLDSLRPYLAGCEGRVLRVGRVHLLAVSRRLHDTVRSHPPILGLREGPPKDQTWILGQYDLRDAEAFHRCGISLGTIIF